jgi:Protein phosphatase inhibitor
MNEDRSSRVEVFRARGKGTRPRNRSRASVCHQPQPQPGLGIIPAGRCLDSPQYLLQLLGTYPAYSIMSLVTQSGPSSSMSREGSRTALIVQNAEQRDASALTVGRPPAGTLRLRGGPRARPHVVWDEDVVDNEGLGRKKSKSTYGH